MDTLREVFLKLEKKEKLYRDLVYSEREILRKPIKVPKALDAKGYATVYKPWYAYWDAIRKDNTNGIVIHRANRVVGVIGKDYAPVSFTVMDAVSVFRYLGLLHKKDWFLKSYDMLTKNFAELSDWCFRNREKIASRDGFFFAEQVLGIAQFIKAGVPRNCYMTQWQIPKVDTKFHKKHFEVFREVANAVLDIKLQNRAEFMAYFGVKERLPEVNVSVIGGDFSLNGNRHYRVDFESLNEWIHIPKVVFIFENKDIGNWLGSEATIDSSVPSVLLYGAGNAISSLEKVAWFHDVVLYYCGDLDIDGFAILNRLRHRFPQLKTFLMDFDAYREAGDIQVEDMTSKDRIKELAYLTDSEYRCFRSLLDNAGRMEHERIPVDLLVNTIQQILKEVG